MKAFLPQSTEDELDCSTGLHEAPAAGHRSICGNQRRAQTCNLQQCVFEAVSGKDLRFYLV